MPPVALTAASVPAPLSSRVAPAIAPCPVAETAPVPVALPAPALAEPPVLPARPRLRLVPAVDAAAAAGVAEVTAAGGTLAEVIRAEVPEVHGHGGPASCRCRACVMARHPASMLPRLTVVR